LAKELRQANQSKDSEKVLFGQKVR